VLRLFGKGKGESTLKNAASERPNVDQHDQFVCRATAGVSSLYKKEVLHFYFKIKLCSSLLNMFGT
jgi:hypothetical protein